MPLRLRLLPTPGQPAGLNPGPSAGRSIEFADGTNEIRIGRRADVELPLPFPALSGLHARLSRSSDGWRIEDLGSTNGTRVDGEHLRPGETRALTAGAQVALGEVTLIFDGMVSPILGAEGTATIARRLVSDLFAAAPGAATPTLTIVSGVPAAPPLRLEELDRRYLAGRVETCDLHLLSDEISREHAAFVRLWDGVVVKDLDSKNGVLVNDALVVEQRLRDGDLVRLGPAALRLSDPADRYLRDFEAQAHIGVGVGVGVGVGEEPAPDAPPPAEGVPAPIARVDTQPPADPAPPAVGPAKRSSGSRTAIVVAAIVLLIVGAVVLALVVG